MHRAGFPFLALTVVAFVALHAQCVALCELGICPQPAAPQCPHHPHGKMPAGTGHACQPQPTFFAKSAGNWVPAPAMQAGNTAAAASPAESFSWTRRAPVSTSPPATLALALAAVIRV